MSSNYASEPLHQACRRKDLPAVQALLKDAGLSQATLDAGLAGALWYGKPDQWPVMQAIADELLAHGANVDGRIGDYGPIVFGTGECAQPQSLQYLLDHGADVSFAPIDTKYGQQCAMSYWLGSYGRGDNTFKHQGIELLLEHHAYMPPEVTPAMLAIHRGDSTALATLLEADTSLLEQTFPTMPYGNMLLRGATLLHCAAEHDEIACCQVLLDHGADINARAQVIQGVGGQTPLFHVVNTIWDSHLRTLLFLAERSGHAIDLSIAATWSDWQGPRASPATLSEYVHEPGDARRKNRQIEIDLLHTLEDER